MTQSSLDKEMQNIQDQIKSLTTASTSASATFKRPTLDSIPSGPNIARGSNEVWSIHQYNLAHYKALQELPTELEFLQNLDPDPHPSSITRQLKVRLSALEEQQSTPMPRLALASTSLPVLSYEQKTAKARLIAQHIIAEASVEDPVDKTNKIRDLQSKLMKLEEQYLDQ
jgi:hypothetical protein